jgi:DCN1-like protein 4/5|uniref:Defective in cullin neddylation protein n=1 Tax=Eutreptiella gymnastica TaxID=73025 RepID=A0A7S4LM59_9EUGL
MAAVWAWQDERGDWNEYDHATSQAIEAALVTRKPKLSIRANRYTYTVDLRAMKQVNDNTKQSRPIRQICPSKPKMPNKEVEQLFEKYLNVVVTEVGDKTIDSLQGSAFEALCEDLGIDVEDPVLLVLAWKSQAKHSFSISRDEWARAMIALHVDSLKKLKAAIPAMRAEITDKDAFKDFYFFVFDFVKEDPATVLGNDTALAYWQLLLGPQWPLTNSWCTFISEVYKKAITRDVWKQLYYFSQLPTSLESYDIDEGAWPSVMDDFVDWFREKK